MSRISPLGGRVDIHAIFAWHTNALLCFHIVMILSRCHLKVSTDFVLGVCAVLFGFEVVLGDIDQAILSLGFVDFADSGKDWFIYEKN